MTVSIIFFFIFMSSVFDFRVAWAGPGMVKTKSLATWRATGEGGASEQRPSHREQACLVRFPSWNAACAALMAGKCEHHLIEKSLNNQQRERLPSLVLRLRIDERKFSIGGCGGNVTLVLV
jgi:hypothetical protein